MSGISFRFSDGVPLTFPNQSLLDEFQGITLNYFFMSAKLLNILFTDGGGKLLLTQVVSARYSIQDDGVLFFLFELCKCLGIVVSDY